MLPKTLIVFDIDGTLAHSTGVDDACYAKTFLDLYKIDLTGVNWDDFPFVTDSGIAESIYQQHFHKNLPPEEEVKIRQHFCQLIEKEITANPSLCEEIPGARNFIELLQKKHTVGIATGGWEYSARLKLNAIGINPNDFPFAGADNTLSRESIMLNVQVQALSSAQVNRFEKAFYFGDGVWDYYACKNLQFKFIGVDVSNNGKLKREGARTVITDFSEPEKILSLLK